MNEHQALDKICMAMRFQHGEYRPCERPFGHKGKHKNFSYRNMGGTMSEQQVLPEKQAETALPNKMFDAVEFQKLPPPEDVSDGIPYVTHKGVLTIMGCDLEVFVLNTGQQVISEESFMRFFEGVL